MITGMQHVGVCVSNLENSLAFYCGTLGLKKQVGFEIEEEKVSRNILGLPGAKLRVAMVQHGESTEATVIELIQFLSPSGKGFPDDFQYNNVGITHIAFKVTEIDKMYNDLVGKGVRFNSPVQTVETKELGTIKAAYFRDPDGISLELMEY
jgi:catechol 2,3-dioxygenase-like lactoylglutathione lyase family enzyme